MQRKALPIGESDVIQSLFGWDGQVMIAQLFEIWIQADCARQSLSLETDSATIRLRAINNREWMRSHKHKLAMIEERTARALLQSACSAKDTIL